MIEQACLYKQTPEGLTEYEEGEEDGEEDAERESEGWVSPPGCHFTIHT